MKAKKKRPTRFTTKRRYVRELGRTAFRLVLSALAVVLGIGGMWAILRECVVFMVAHPKMEVEGFFAVMVGMLLEGLFWMLTLLGAKALENTMKRDPAVIVFHPEADFLPLQKTLVRPSSEPIQEQQTILLRAAQEGQKTPAEQLLRPCE